MQEAGKLVSISPCELDALLARMQEEKRSELILLGPRAYLDRQIQNWPLEYRNRLVFRLNSHVDGLERQLLRLADLRILNLRGNHVGTAGAQAIAQHLPQLTSLNLQINKVGEAGAQAIAQHLTQLTSLNLSSNPVGEAGAKAIAQRLTQLISLDLGYADVGEAGAQTIAQHLTQLTSLDLAYDDIGDVGAQAIAQHLTQLTSLNLQINKVGEAGAQAIAQHLTQLTSLNLQLNKVGEAGAKAIAQRLIQLTSLDLQYNEIGEAGAKAIAQHVTQLTSLNLQFNDIGEAGAKAIAQRLTQLTSLDLQLNGVGDAGAQTIAEHLTRLTWLSLSNNRVGDAGAKAIAQRLTQLTSLDLSNNQVGGMGAQAIAEHLTQLTSLDLSNNQVGGMGAQAIAEHLTQLTSLDLSNNQVGDMGAQAIAQHLTQLTWLDLSKNQLSDAGTQAIAEHLTQLTSLDLSNNQVGDMGAQAIARHLTQLTWLDLSNNQLSDAGAQVIAQHFTQITWLNLSSNQVGDTGAQAIAQHLTQLTWLGLSNTQVGDAGAQTIVEHLTQLTSLRLRENENISSVERLSNLYNLEILDLSKTRISDLSPLRKLIIQGLPVSFESYGTGVIVEGCPLVHPSLEVIKQGREAVLNYFREIEEQGVDHLYEAKVLIIGGGGAGKTSLVRRLYQPDQPLPSEDETTRGIEIHRHDFQSPGKTTFRLNIWDFGGQQIYHATHQFFFTKNSLYVLVDDTRKSDRSAQDDGFKYWLEVVEVLSDHSPVLIFQNERGGRSKQIDEAGIKRRFTDVQETYRGNLEEAHAAYDLRRAIEYHTSKLPHIGEEVPAKWPMIRNAIEARADRDPYISQEEYFAIYRQHLEFDRNKALHLSRYFHDLGAFLHFQDDLRLRKTVVLQNRWATEAVFKILDDETIKSRFGRFTAEDCKRLWASGEYADMHLELLAMMEKFEICYLLAGAEPPTWLAPQLLSPSRPESAADWAMLSDLVLAYRYDFLPRGLVSRLMVRLHRFVEQPSQAWSTGALFEREQSQLLAEETLRGNEIILRARGPEKKALLSVVASELDVLNASFAGLKDKVGKWVPCICEKCTQTASPELFEETRLKQRKKDGRMTIECPGSYAEVSVLELLDGLRLDNLPTWAGAKPADAEAEKQSAAAFETEKKQPRRAEKTVKIFLASSSELRDDRDDFDLYFRQQNDRLRKEGLYLQIVRWENFLDVMSETRLQNEYNREIRACDIFVSLFMTKTGKYTEEEFDVAHQIFKETEKPLIYTFFKKASVSTSSSHRDDLMSLWAFQEKLKGLGHFQTEYNGVEHLKRQFKDQLEKLRDQDRL